MSVWARHRFDLDTNEQEEVGEASMGEEKTVNGGNGDVTRAVLSYLKANEEEGK